MDAERSDDGTLTQGLPPRETPLLWALGLVMGVFVVCVMLLLLVVTLREVRQLQGEVAQLRWAIEHRENVRRP